MKKLKDEFRSKIDEVVRKYQKGIITFEEELRMELDIIEEYKSIVFAEFLQQE